LSKSKVIAGIEIGTSKVAVLLGEIVEGRSLNVVGLGQCPSRGILKGEIVDFSEASDCVHAAIIAAENQAGVKIDGAFLAQSGPGIEGFVSEASVNIASDDGCVRPEDVSQLAALAQERELDESRMVIHHLRRPYRLDGRVVESPVGMQGDRLEVAYWTAHGDARKISDAIHVVNGINLHVDDIILSGLAAGSAVATMEEKANGVLAIDLGQGTTDYALYGDGRCLTAGCLALGGDHISNDLSIGLRMRFKQAESLKQRYGSAILETAGREEKVWLNNDFEIGDRPLPLWSIEKIVSLRAAEIFEVLRKRLGALLKPERLAGGVILTGGGSRLRNIEACAQRVFGCPARLGDNRAMASGELRDPEYSVALGLLRYGLQYQSAREEAAALRQSGFIGRIKEIFHKSY